MRICISGGAGFVGSHLVEHFHRIYQRCEIVVIDNLTYAGNIDNLRDFLNSPRVDIVRASVADYPAMLDALKKVNLVIHAAAESHVDRSYEDVRPFLESNIEGTVSIMRAAVANGVDKFVHVSTDEVYGDTLADNLPELAPLRPTNPYAASKAAAEMFVSAYEISFGLPTVRLRSNNMYGTRQHPEKLIPKAIESIGAGEDFFVHGDGSQRRAFLSVLDFCEAVECVSTCGEPGSTYNVGAEEEYSVLEIVELVCRSLGVNPKDAVKFAAGRPYNDSRYGLVCDKLKVLGWRPKRRLTEDIGEIVNWSLRKAWDAAPTPVAIEKSVHRRLGGVSREGI